MNACMHDFFADSNPGCGSSMHHSLKIEAKISKQDTDIPVNTVKVVM